MATGGIGGPLMIASIILLAVIGWIANAVKLAHLCCDVSGWLVLRAIGVVVAPLGVVLGFL